VYTATSFDTTQSLCWEQVKKSILGVPSYKRFLEVTSKQDLLVVRIHPDFSSSNKAKDCHSNCHLLELEGKGKAVSGWYLMCDLIFNEFPKGLCRLVHHSNLELKDGSVINPTIDLARMPFHIFLKDDARHYDLKHEIGFNDRMIFGDDFDDADTNISKNKVYYARDDQRSRDVFFEKFKVYKNFAEIAAVVPRHLSDDEKALWMALKIV